MKKGVGEMDHIFEASSAQINEVVALLRENWEELQQRPLAKSEELENSYWEAVHRNGRIFFYRSENGSIAAIISLSKKETLISIDLFYVTPQFRKQGIGEKMVRFAERAAANWSGEHINIMFSGREELDRIFPMFQSLGYIFHCPINQKGNVLLEKKIQTRE